MKWALGILAFVAIGGVLLVGKKAAAATSASTGGSFLRALEKSARAMSSEVVAGARKWAAARGLPVSDVLATVLLESRGNPKAHKKTGEDSRGLMQVNVAAHGPWIAKSGHVPDDLFKIDFGLEAGTLVLANARKKVQELLAATKVKQAHDLSTLTRLYYAGPKYVINMLKTAKSTADTAHVFKNSETYVSHWLDAKQAVRTVWPEVA